MQNRDYQQSLDFLNGLFGETVQQVELRACHNVNKGVGIAPVFSRDAETWKAFCRRQDKAGQGVYFGVCTRREGAVSGNLSTVAECPALWVDIDCAKQEILGEEALSALQFLPFPPTMIVNSGGGLHGYWQLEEAVDVSEGSAARDVVSASLKALARILAGDMAVTELARIMRLPGTHNSKEATLALYDGEPALCEVLETTGRVYGLEALVEWLADQRAVLHGKPATPRPVNEADPFVAYAREAGYEPAIDIDAALAAMEHGATGENSIHQTQLRVSASMIARGYADDEIVNRLLAATEAAAPRDRQWNWAAEESQIRKMIATGRGKGYEKKRERLTVVPQSSGNTALSVVSDLGQEREKRAAPKADKESRSATVAVGRAAIGVWQDRHGPVMHTGGLTYAYEAGVWSVWDERLAQRLRVIIQEACASLKIEPKTSLLGAARAYFMDRPELIQHDVEFDAHGLLVAADACLDLQTFEIVPHSPDHFAIRKTAATLAGNRDHSTLDAFLAEAFSDRPEARAILATVQEWFGAAIMPLPVKQRGQKKGLFAHGPSRCSKTQISELARHLLGHSRVCGARMSDLEDRFGTEPLIGKYGWIADDAVGEGEFLNADIFKVVVTGEQTSTKTKGGKNWEGRFGIPVLMTANSLFRVKDQSDAVYNRLLILPMTNVRDELAPEPVGYESIADKIGKTELTGLLWWAIEGWQRLSARGTFDPPAVMLDAGKALKDDNNPVGAWRQECLEMCPDGKVLRADLLASMNGWSALEYGADARPWSGRGFFPKLTKMIPGYSKESHETADVDGNRMMIGIRLTKAGLLAWRTHKDSRYGDVGKTSSSEDLVNKDHALARVVQQPPEDRRPRF